MALQAIHRLRRPGLHACLQMTVPHFSRAVKNRVRQLGISTSLLECNRCEPLWTAYGGVLVAFGVDQPFVGDDFLINAMEGMLAAVRHAHPQPPCAAWAQVHLAKS